MAGETALGAHLFWLGSILGEPRRSRRMLRNLTNTGRSERCGTQVTTLTPSDHQRYQPPGPQKFALTLESFEFCLVFPNVTVSFQIKAKRCHIFLSTSRQLVGDWLRRLGR